MTTISSWFFNFKLSLHYVALRCNLFLLLRMVIFATEYRVEKLNK